VLIVGFIVIYVFEWWWKKSVVLSFDRGYRNEMMFLLCVGCLFLREGRDEIIE
jgi:hypothetical protein